MTYPVGFKNLFDIQII